MIYLDHAATTPVCRESIEAMHDALSYCYGNPSSLYETGRKAKEAITLARKQVASLMDAEPECIVFTSGGTESDNHILRMIAYMKKHIGKHLIVSSIEHHAILHTADYLETQGFTITRLPVNKEGLVSVNDLEAAIRPDTILVSIMTANNEIGTIQPVKELCDAAHRHNILFHTDAVQALGQIPLSVKELDVDFLSASAHKIYGPKGIGCLYIKKGLDLSPFILGGGQEHSLRAGTENVPGIVGFGAACAAIRDHVEENMKKETALRDDLIETILSVIPGSRLNGSAVCRLPNNVNISFADVPGESLLLLLDMHGICASAGSACNSENAQKSHVISAIGVPDNLAKGTLRLTLGKDTTLEELEETVSVLEDVVSALRK